ncbi:MAG TPA: uroporphyrinogen decarboxylase family protein [Candidatus Limiplasma sp.]|nr:uroporphyrinogen decarboxylase family protein [Candidatus Limiplasma sp.]HRX09596.1 uroporphyrinogen decarboxylase family protein [Candidatus Limiplasma sp.]
MNSKQRVLNAFYHEKADRVPMNYLSNPGLHKRLAQTLGVEDSYAAVAHALGCDFQYIIPKYTGPVLFPPKPDRNVDPMWGMVTRWVEHHDGGYWDYCEFPLKDADDETIASWPVPNPDHFDVDDFARQCRHFKHKAVSFGDPGLGDLMNTPGMLRGMENIYMDLLTENEAVLTYIDRRLNSQLGVMERVMDYCAADIDFVWTGEDLGTQSGQLISLDLFRSQIRPRHQKIVDLAKAYNKPVMLHSCGSSSWAFEDFVEMGIQGMDTLQPEAKNMEPQYLAEHFGTRLMFHGCMSTAKAAVMTVEEIEAEARQILSIMMPYRGYCFASTHLLQDNTPVENVLAMYRTVREAGRYA